MPKRYHRDSIFGPGRRVPLDREQRARFRAMLRLQRRPGRLTLAALNVGLVLIDLLGEDGRLDPTIDTLAKLARIGRTTVFDALARLRESGFVGWTRRLVRCAGTGWRVEQTSSAYVLLIPATGSDFRTGVPHVKKNKQAHETPRGHNSGGWEEQVENARQQLLALGVPIPARFGE